MSWITFQFSNNCCIFGVIVTFIQVCFIESGIRLELAQIVVHEVVNVCLGETLGEELK